MKTRIPTNVGVEEAQEALKDFFTLDFPGDCDLHYYADGVRAKEVFRTSPVALILHIGLTLFTVGLWLIVWLLIEIVQRRQLESVRVRLFDSGGVAVAEVSGSEAWTQTAEAFIRRNLRGSRVE